MAPGPPAPRLSLSHESSASRSILQGTELYCLYLLSVDLKKEENQVILMPEADKRGFSARKYVAPLGSVTSSWKYKESA